MASTHLEVSNKTKQQPTTIATEAPPEHVEIPPNIRALFLAIKAGDVRKIERLVIADPTIVNAEYEPDVTPLSMAASNKHTGVVSLLLSHRANPNKIYVRAHNATLLHAAAENGQQTIVEVLLKHKANVEAKKDDGATPLHDAAQNGHAQVVRILLKHKADIQAKNDRGQTPLHLATFQGHLEVVQILLQNKAEVNVQSTTNGITPLYLAVNKGHLNIAKILLEQGAGIQARYADDKTLLHVAAQNRHPEIIKLLLSYNADINAVEIHNITPLYIAALTGNVEITKILLENKANTDIAQGDITPLKVARRKGHQQVVHLLESHQALYTAINAQDASEVKRLLGDGAILANLDKKLLLTPELSPILSELEKKKISTAFSSVRSNFPPKTMYFEKNFLVIDFKDDIEASCFLKATSILFRLVHGERTNSNVRLKWPFFIDEAFTETGPYRKRKSQLEKVLLFLQKKLKATSWVVAAITPGHSEMDRNVQVIFQGAPIDSLELKDEQIPIKVIQEGILIELPMEFLFQEKIMPNAPIAKSIDKIVQIKAKEAPDQEKERVRKEEALERCRISAQNKEEQEKKEKEERRQIAQNKKKEVASNQWGRENPPVTEKKTLASSKQEPSSQKEVLSKRDPNKFFTSSTAPQGPQQEEKLPPKNKKKGFGRTLTVDSQRHPPSSSSSSSSSSGSSSGYHPSGCSPK